MLTLLLLSRTLPTLCYLLLFIRLSYALERICRDPIDAVCINDKTAYDAKPRKHHRMFFEGKYVEKKMAGWWDDPCLLPFIQCIIMHLIDLNLLLNGKSECVAKKKLSKMQTIFPNDLHFAQSKRQKCGFCWQWISDGNYFPMDIHTSVYVS